MKVIYRPGLPGELLAPPGINALRQNLMHVLTPKHVHECTSSFKMHKWSENISEVCIIKTEQRNTCKLRMNGVSHTHKVLAEEGGKHHGDWWDCGQQLAGKGRRGVGLETNDGR